MKKDEKRKETNRKIVHQFLFNGINGDFDARDGYYEPSKLEILMPNNSNKVIGNRFAQI